MPDDDDDGYEDVVYQLACEGVDLTAVCLWAQHMEQEHVSLSGILTLVQSGSGVVWDITDHSPYTAVS